MEEKLNTNINNIILKIKELKEDYKESDIQRIFREFPKEYKGLYKKSEILEYFKTHENIFNLGDKEKREFLEKIKMKKVRTISGVTPVTVLTKPFPCPGKCVFCPNDVRMPKSYLSDEPGAQRAFRNKFDPYLQTFNRLLAYKNIGHHTDKVELIILGGTWSAYPRSYQIWFIKRCFDALNDFVDLSKKISTEIISEAKLPYQEDKLIEIDGENMVNNYNQVVKNALSTSTNPEMATIDDLFKAHLINETASTRCIGLVVETRPDEINVEEATFLRSLGTTKVQIGIQSLNDEVLKLNKRGHNVKKTEDAINILRSFGFKIHAHYMPNLYGSTPDQDIEDYKTVFSNINIRPDEIKIYPCSLIKTAELMQIYKKGLWKPYTEPELLKVLKECVKNTPEYCRITRMIRDICSQDIVVGNKKTNFRQIVENSLANEGYTLHEIRSREVKSMQIGTTDLNLNIITYETAVSTEKFMQFTTKKNIIAGFLRLSLPKQHTPNHLNVSTDRLSGLDSYADIIPSELKSSAIIREIHVYGEAVDIGKQKDGRAQHLGIGKALINESMKITKNYNFSKLSVISSVGTREYYRKNGFFDGDLYQYMAFS